MFTIYGDERSGNCLKVLWVARILGLPHRWQTVRAMRCGDTQTSAFLAINPTGEVPAIAYDNGPSISQSNAIIFHLAEGSALIPTDVFERADLLAWMFYEQYSHEPYIAVRRARLALMGQKEEDLDPKLLVGGHEALARMELHLGKHDYFAGSAVSLADIALVAYTRWAPMGGYDLTAYPKLVAWIARIEAYLSTHAGLDISPAT